MLCTKATTIISTCQMNVTWSISKSAPHKWIGRFRFTALQGDSNYDDNGYSKHTTTYSRNSNDILNDKYNLGIINYNQKVGTSLKVKAILID